MHKHENLQQQHYDICFGLILSGGNIQNPKDPNEIENSFQFDDY